MVVWTSHSYMMPTTLILLFYLLFKVNWLNVNEFLLKSPKILKKSEKGWKVKENVRALHLYARMTLITSLATLEFNSDLDFEKLVFLDKSPFALTKPRGGLEEKNLD